ncbi:MAG: hypothetical protein MK160_06320 [Rhodobacteraceae bacterium]|nr:hypothetical protein [Paracoccaceae bacterium]
MFRCILVIAVTTALTSPVFAQTLPFAFPADRDSRQVSVVVDEGITNTADLPNRALREARLAMVAKKVVSDDDLRGLAEAKDGLAAAKLVDVLVGRGIPENASDIAYFGAIAVGTGRIWPLDEMVEAMWYLDPDTEPKGRKAQMIKVLYAHAWAGNSLALQAVIDFNGDGKLFGKLSEKTRQKILLQAEKNADGRAELRLALAILQTNDQSDADLARARDYLTRAALSPELPVQVTAANILALLDEKQKETLAGN